MIQYFVHNVAPVLVAYALATATWHDFRARRYGSLAVDLAATLCFIALLGALR